MWTIVGYVAAVLTTASFLPQAFKVIKTNNTRGISLYMYVAFSIGVLLWALYGIFTYNIAIAVANAITFVIAIIIMTFKIRNIVKSDEKP